MSRPKTEINPERAKRFKMLIEREKLTQSALSEKIHLSQQAISHIFTEKNALTEETARNIINAFPEYRLEWLLGYDDYMTHKEYLAAQYRKGMSEAEALESAFFSLASLSGFEIAPTDPATDKKPENIVNAIQAGFTISRDGKSVTLSLSDLNALENELCDYLEFRLLHIMK